jgi:hypothetical protein
MIEIIILSALCMANSQRADLRGKNRVLAYVYTVALWIGLEVFGAIASVLVMDSIGHPYDFWVYVGALVGASIGGVLSFVIASIGEQLVQPIGNLTYAEITYISQNYMLPAPCKVVVFRAKSLGGAALTYRIQLNGVVVAELKNGAAAEFYTSSQNNIVTANTNARSNTRLQGAVQFAGLPGGRVEIHIKGNTFKKDRTVITPGAPMPTPMPVNAPPQY